MHWIPVILIIPYCVILLIIYRSLLQIKPFNVSAVPVTLVSIVVACRNEEKNLQLLLKCIAEQDYPKELFEIIVVDDNSTDKTYEAATGYTQAWNIKALHNNGKGKKQSVRTGINASVGNLIITTDADCRMGKNWIRTISAFYEKHKPDMIICPVQIEASQGFFGKFQQLEFLSLQGITAGSAISGNGTMCNGANLSFTRKAYTDQIANLHDEIASGDDIFFLQSLKKDTRSKILWLESTEAIVTTSASASVRSFLDQRSRWISKAGAYNDMFTIILGIVTFVTILIQFSVLVSAFINRSFIPALIIVFVLKSMADLLILVNTSRRYGRSELMFWLLPSLIVYPFYVLSVIFYSVILKKFCRINFPFQKEI